MNDHLTADTKVRIRFSTDSRTDLNSYDGNTNKFPAKWVTYMKIITVCKIKKSQGNRGV